MIGFTAPWILMGLLALPGLWFLLKTSPPPPQKITLPSAHFLSGLNADETHAARTPLWLLILRMLLIALLIIAFAGPVLNPPRLGTARSGAPVLLVIDNGWAAAKNMGFIKNAAQNVIDNAAIGGQSVRLIPTAQGHLPFEIPPPLNATAASTKLQAIKPRPWAPDYRAVADALATQQDLADHEIVWISDGIYHSGFKTLLNTLNKNNNISFIVPDFTSLPYTIKAEHKNNRAIVARPFNPDMKRIETAGSVQAVGQDGKILAQQDFGFDQAERERTITFDYPQNIKSRIAFYRISPARGANDIYILDSTSHTPNIGIYSPEGESPADAQSFSLTSPQYYLSRALSADANIYLGFIEDLIARKPDAIILPDMGDIDEARLNALDEWVQQGGTLIRFAGAAMVQDYASTRKPPFLTPVALRANNRNLDGALSWDEPQSLQAFPETSPFYGFALPPEGIKIRKQILAEPGADLADHSWAALNDGTPFITARRKQSGLIVLVHTTANTDWSDFALSGLYPKILLRLSQMGGISGNIPMDYNNNDKTSLDPVFVLGGTGARTQPENSNRPLKTDTQINISPENPPGLYGNKKGLWRAVNIGDHIKSYSALSDALKGLNVKRGQDVQNAKSLKPLFLTLTLAFMLIDWLCVIAIRRGWGGITNFKHGALNILICTIIGLGVFYPSASARAQATDFSQDIFLGFIETNNPALNARIRQGLTNLGQELTKRTAIEPAGVHAINLEKDEISFFPFIYWPVQAGDMTDLSANAKGKLQHYLGHGGTILFDTGFGPPTANQNALRGITSGLTLPPLQKIDNEHVLQKSFYLLPVVMDMNQSGTIWVADPDMVNGDNVSPIIISDHGWAAIWAARANPNAYELSIRFGINWIMVALTGFYKADQVHLPHILERMGE